MQRNFAAALKLVLKHEGGYVDHPSDPGGATNQGITRKTLARWRGLKDWRQLPKSEVKNISADEVRQIYKARYWDKVRGDDLPSGLDYCVFDFAVNSGWSRAAIALQRVLGVADDGVIGPVTLEAVSKANTKRLINKMCDDRMRFLKRLRHWSVFGKGWSRRVSGVRRDALAWADVSTAPTPPERPQAAKDSPLMRFLTFIINTILNWGKK
ncbi:hypothetical protein MXMO3_01726 [Maritalea myrionectae]|uniref:Uncharacterized protein n=1 Tax=Maritalea myrionectae TaxID=454601 RepID=A0A2R4ME15_9HYPH|nr:glycoside hydrolase family 108 protein [Maritalea myrionectae]AVX04252.1 hypothetical protein MXMO3_01726 [Maritalea myrionectae]